MTKPVIVAVGTVRKMEMVQPSKEGAKPFLSVAIDCPEEEWNGKKFGTRCEARVHYQPNEVMARLHVGGLVSAHGNARAEGYIYDERPCGRLVIERANVLPLEAKEPRRGDAPSPAAPAASPAETVPF